MFAIVVIAAMVLALAMAIIQFYLVAELQLRDPETYNAIGRPGMLGNSSSFLFGFVLSGEYRERLSDPHLLKGFQLMQRCAAVFLVLWCISVVFIVLSRGI